MASERRVRRIERLLDEAEDAVSRLDWETVRGLAQAVLAFDPDNADALDLLTGAERALGRGATGAEVGPQTPAAAPATEIKTRPDPDANRGEGTSFADGRYLVKRFLGQGGKKQVYLAHDTTLDREVAFALIKTDGLDETSRTRITREAQAMGRLGSHPHVVTVFDLGEEPATGDSPARPYMVTELMSGGDVEGLIENATDHRLPLEQAIRITRETCRGLEFAHRRGIVHRDLKPGNVWLTEDGTAKIGDFGLAVALDRSRLTTEGMMVGTVAYMPPEQAMGGEVSPRSDLYSVGAMLYEMVTGRPPFLGDDAVAIIGQHINTPPVSPTWHNNQCPRPLEALIMRLLAKNPSERPESATDVLYALDAIDLATSVEQPAADVDEAHALDSLAGGVFVGRQREMGDLKAALEDALSGRGRLVMLVGEPGIGKSRTAQELATYAGLRHAKVLWGRCYDGEGAPPYWPWVQAIRSYVRDKEPEELRSEMGVGAEDIAEIVSDVRERLPGLRTPPQLEPEQARFRLFDSITAFLKSAARRQPLVLVLDDLHWADHPSLLLLEFVARELSSARLLIIGTYRDMELSRQHPLSRSLGELTRERLFQRVLLRGLDQEDVGRFIELASGITPPTGMVEAVHRQTEGNPLFVTEVVRLLVQEGELTQEKAGQRDSWNVRIPEGVREVIGRRLDRLSERCNETLTTASVVGREFTLEQLRPLIEDMSEDRLLEVLEEALAARVIEELPRSVGRYQFTHALIQETLAGELSTTRRVRLHARIAESLEELYGADAEVHAAELARHFSEAQTVLGTEKLVRYTLVAGERALATYAHEEALVHFQIGLASKEGQPMDAQTAALCFGLGVAQAATLETHQIRDAVASLSRAFDYYVEVGELERAVAVAEHPFPMSPGQTTGASQLITRALALVPPDSHEAGRLLCRYVTVLVMEGTDYEAAQEVFSRALDIARREGDEALEMRILAGATDPDVNFLRLQGALVKSLRVLELAQHADDPRTEVHARYFGGMAQLFMADLEGTRQQAAAMLVTAERLRDHHLLAGAHYLNQITSSLGGNWQSSRDFSDRGLAVSPMDARLLGSRAMLESEVGEIDQAFAYLERFLVAMRLSAPGPTLVNSWTALLIPSIARITGRMDQLDVAEEAAEAVLSSPAVTPVVTFISRCGLAMLAVLRSDAASAEEQYGALESAAGIGVPASVMRTVRAVPISFTPIAHLLGLLAQTMGNLDRSMDHFEDSLTLCRRAGFRPDLAWTCCDYADALLQRASTSSATTESEEDRRKAMALLDESLTISSELGMRPLMERVLSRRDILTA
ncbi:MAG: protein kinase [Chloroflexi bacterium]|nr:protein kinase [Chloroflexota bacterium]